MKFHKKILILICYFIGIIAYSQENLTSKEAKSKFDELQQQIIKNNKELEFPFKHNFRIYLELLEVVQQITDEPLTRLYFYHGNAYKFRTLDLHEEVVKVEKLFYDDYLKQPDSVFKDDEMLWKLRATYNLGQWADAYAKLGKIDSAEIAHKEALSYADEVDAIFNASIHNNYGLFLLGFKNDLDAAMENFYIAESVMSNYDKNEHFYGSIRDNIADVHLMKGDSLKARDLYFLNFDFYTKVYKKETNYIDFFRLFSAGYQFITTSIEMNKTQHIDSIFERMKEYRPELNDNPSNLEAKLVYLKTKEAFLLHKEDSATAYETAKEIIDVEKRIEEIANQTQANYNEVITDNTIENIRLDYELDKEQQLSKINSQRLKLWIISLSALLLTAILGFLYYRRQKKLEIVKNDQLLTEQRLEISKLKNEQLNHEIEAKKRDLSDFAINLSQSQEWAKSLSKKLNDIKKSRGRERGNLMKDLEEEVINKLKFDSNTKVFYERLDELNNAFYLKLNNDYPNLSKNERRLCSLIRLKVDSHDIATLQNISLASLNTSRYRLRKKLNLSEDENLDDFILSL